MKILVFNWKDITHPERGGAEVFTYEIAKRWVKYGNQVTWFSSHYKGANSEDEIEGIKIFRAGGKYTVYKKAKEFYEKVFIKQNFDVVIDETNTRPFFANKFVKNSKIVFLIHQLAREWWFYETSFPINIIGYYLENYWLKKYSNYPTVTVSKSTMEDLKTLGFEKIKIVSEGISFKPFHKMPKKYEKPVLCYLGRLNRGKRVELAIKAFKIVKNSIKDAEFWIIGDGYYRNFLEKIKGDGVKFFGRVSEKDKIRLLSLSWLHVNPSIREGWGINVIEANACGTPCIAFDVPGLRDSIVDGKTGILVKENGNIEKLAEAIIRVLTDDKLRDRLSRNALKHSKKFSWDKSAKEFLEILESFEVF